MRSGGAWVGAGPHQGGGANRKDAAQGGFGQGWTPPPGAESTLWGEGGRGVRPAGRTEEPGRSGRRGRLWGRHRGGGRSRRASGHSRGWSSLCLRASVTWCGARDSHRQRTTTVSSSLASVHCAHHLVRLRVPPTCTASAFPVAGARGDGALGTRGTLRPAPPLLLVLLCRPLPSAPPRVLPKGASLGFSWSQGGSLHTPARHSSGCPCTVSEQRRGLLPRRPRAVTRQFSICSSGLSLPVFSASTQAPTSACLSVSLQGLPGLHNCP